MGILDNIRGRKVYLDTNIFIYALEGYDRYTKELTKLFEAIDKGRLSAATSELTLAELLVKPMMDGDTERQKAYQEALNSTDHFEVVPISRNILILAARLRAKLGMKLPDAIHFATAWESYCTTFITNDMGLRRGADMGIHVVLINDVL